MSAPLYEALARLAGKLPLRFDMPGHHGQGLLTAGLADTALDFTENGCTGDLFGEGSDSIEAAERLWARTLRVDACLFLTGGSTQGLHTGLAMLAGTDGDVALDRGSHRSSYHAMALLGLRPHYLSRPWLASEGVAGPIDPAEVERTLSTYPEIKTVSIVSPTYYGVLSDIPAIAQVCHTHGVRLLVDGAHGAHLPYFGYRGYSKADIVVLSAHKTLPALGQSAILAARGFSMNELRRFGSVYGSSSPSYLLMASLDLAREYMEGEGMPLYRRCAERCAALRGRFPTLRAQVGLELDPTRLCVKCRDGFRLAELLRERNIFPEMADTRHVVFILTAADNAERLDKLEAALTALLEPPDKLDFPAPPPFPPIVNSPRAALFASRRRVPLVSAAGLVAAEQIAPYPPGVPVVAPGEQITKKHLAYLDKIGYNKRYVDVVK